MEPKRSQKGADLPCDVPQLTWAVPEVQRKELDAGGAIRGPNRGRLKRPPGARHARTRAALVVGAAGTHGLRKQADQTDAHEAVAAVHAQRVGGRLQSKPGSVPRRLQCGRKTGAVDII